jgi:DNA-binding NarL/FixJ family response regulator
MNDMGWVEQARARVLIVDEYPIVRHGIKCVIADQTDLMLCGEAASRAQALDIASEVKPDIAVVDISLPGESGLGLIKDLSTTIRVLVFSQYDEVLYAERALNAGAAGYAAKDEPISNLLEAIRTVVAGKMYVSKRVTERLLHRVAGPGRTTPSGTIGALSDRELEVFRMIGKGMGTRDIAEMLHLSRKTVETHRENIKRKLNVRSGTELVVRATAWLLER